MSKTFLCLIPVLISIVIFLFSQSNFDKFHVSTWNVRSQTLSIIDNEFRLSTPTIDQIFQDDHTWVATLSAERKRTFIATGDIIPARSVNYQTVSRNNFLWPYEKTAEVLKSADLTFINLESPLIPNCPVTQEGMVFCGDQRHLEGLKSAGVDVINLANNHAGNYGQEGIEDTVRLLMEGGMQPTGLGKPVFKDINGLKFAFLGYNDLDFANEGPGSDYWKKIQSDVQIAKKSAVIVIAAFHWGTEYTDQPSPRQRELAHLAIDSGADLIIGNHPHWIQPVEVYHDKLITYAHGNFIFDQMWSEKTREGVVGKYTFFNERLIDVEFLPVKIENYGQPYFLEGTEKQRILDNMKLLSLGK